MKLERNIVVDEFVANLLGWRHVYMQHETYLRIMAETPNPVANIYYSTYVGNSSEEPAYQYLNLPCFSIDIQLATTLPLLEGENLEMSLFPSGKAQARILRWGQGLEIPYWQSGNCLAEAICLAWTHNKWLNK